MSRGDKSWGGCVHEWFEAQAKRIPDAVAVRDERTSVTYAELKLRADRVACRLRALGVKPEVRVGLCLERSVSLPAALLGIWKAGGAYVPLDPSNPPERLSYILRDAGITVLLTEARLVADLPEHGAEVVLVDAPHPGAACHPSPMNEGGVGGGGLAYVIYTSGSTGAPKGVMVEHGSLAHTLGAARDELGLADGDVMAVLAAFSFDIFLFELLLPLVSGGTALLLSRASVLDPGALLAALERVTAFHAVPSLMRQVVASLRTPAAPVLSGIGKVFVGGEAVPPDLLEEMREVFPAAEIRVLYGPTEGTIVCASYGVPREGPVPGRMIGTALGDATLLLRDGAGREVADGEEGEIWLGGPGVSRGYLGREDLTGERYVVVEGRRFYRTGDLARRLPDGNLEFRGRTDDQVKIRGYRIEPGEVESVLARAPGVRAAAVAAREDASGETHLVAYLVTEPGSDPSGVRGYLRERLPEYLVPGIYVVLDGLPLTPHGKVDRRALPAPAWDRADPGREHVAPRTPVEQVLSGILAGVLGAERVGIHDDFFALGGHSLRAMRVVAGVRDALGVDLPAGALFEHPTVARLAEAVQRSGGAGRAVDPYAVPVARPDRAPLSFSQEAVWFLQQLYPQMRAYSFHAAIRLTGTLDVPALEGTLAEIVRRHEIFRTTFPVLEGSPVQHVHEPWPVRLPRVDLGSIPEADRDATIRALLAAEFRRPYDLERLPLVRWTLLRLGPGEHLLVHAEHHFLHDGWSFGRLLHELNEIYGALSRGDPSPLPELPLQFADFAVRQREWVRGPEGTARLARWRERLAGVPVLELPTDRPRPAVMSFRGNARRVKLPPRLGAAVRAFAGRHGATVYMTLLAAFEALLYRYTGQEDFAVGSAVANRRWRSLHEVMGFVVNTVALRVDLSGDPTFRELLRRVRGVALEAYEHEEVPFEQVVGALHPDRRASHLPVYQVAFSFHDSPYPEFRLPGLEVEVVDGLGNGSAKFDLNVIVIPHAEQSAGAAADDVTLLWEYGTDLFDEATIVRLIAHFETLLEGAMDGPEQRISELPLLAADERARLATWNDTAAPYPPATIHGLFEAQAARTPDAVALVFEGETLTYRELDARADALARHLRARGAGPEVRVGVCMERSLEMVVALLGTLKAGAAYVPLDPGYPAERLAYVVRDAAVPVILSQERLLESIPATGAEVVCLDGRALEEEDAVAGCSLFPVSCSLSLAYVIYTSGSTGEPKGVMNTHRAVVNRLLWGQERFGLTAADVVLQKTPFGFDVSVPEFFWPLLAGARLVLARPDGHRDPLYLSAAIERERVTTVHFVPSMLQAFLEAGEPRQCGSLRRVSCSGEALAPEVRDRFLERFPGVELHNLYGPTEAAVEVTHWACGRGEPTVPIGRPVANTRIHVVDRSLGATPAGVPGELCIGGVQVARGYLGKPGLTAERFVPDPFSAAPGMRLYRTGDRARWRADGTVEYLGRLDEQVKIRGFRIEPGEIEAVLLRHPRVAEAAVVAREDGRGGRRLVGYVVAAGDTIPAAAELRAHLAAWVPEYMVPAVFVPLEALPLGPSGKLDRRALPAPEAGAAGQDASVAPRTEEEAVLARIWKALLRTERVGVHDNFFELGGDSILSIQMVSRAATAGVRLTPEQVFRHQTIAGLALAAGSSEAGGAEQGAVTGEVPLTPIQHWFFEQELTGPQHWNQAWLLDAREPLDPGVLVGAVERLQRHHDALRLRFRRDGAGWRQLHAPAGDPPPVTRVELSAVAASRLDTCLARVAADAQASLDLSAGPLFRVVHLVLGRGRERLLFVVHHLAVDGVSWRILLEDLDTALRRPGQGEPVRLPPKTVSYREWAERVREHARSPAVRAETEFWLAQAEGPVHPLPRDRRGDNTEGSVRVVTVALSGEETRALLQEVPAAYRTRIDDVLLAALGRALTAWTGARSAVVDLEGHGREPLFAGTDLSRTVGWFTAIHPVRLEADPSAGPGDLLRGIKEQLRAIPGKGIGYGLLRYLGDPAVAERLAGVRPEVSFNYHGRLDSLLPEGSRFGIAPESPGPVRHPAARRRYLLDVVGSVVEGRLRMRWHYGEAVHDRGPIEGVATQYLATLRELIAHCRSAGAGGRTPSDFPLAGIGQAALDRLAAALDLGPGGRELEDLYPLTPLQQGMLFHARLDRGAYFEQFVYPVRGDLHVSALRRAWDRVVARHPVLRTAFAWDGLPEPLQAVRSRASVPFHAEDWRAHPADEQADRLDEYLVADRERGFELDRAPLMRIALFRVRDDAWEMVWSHHHLLLDGWSAVRVLGEVLALYHASCEGESAELPRPYPYRDYVAWLRGQDPGDAEEFWRRELEGFAGPTLPGAASAGVDGTDGPEHGELRRTLPGELAERLSALARGHRLTSSTLVRGAWALLLARWSGGDDVLFGATVSGRPAGLPGVEERIGLFINTLPVRVRVRPDERVLPWLESIQERQVEMRRFEHTSLVEVRGWSAVAPDLPLFETLLVFENYPADRAARDRGVTIGRPRAVERPHYPLTLVVRPAPELSLAVTYRRDRFGRAAAERIVDDLQALLHEIAADPGRTLRDVAGAIPPPPAVQPRATRPTTPPATTRELLRVWSEVLGRAVTGTDEDFFALGGDSLAAARITAGIRRRFGVDLPVRALFDAPTVAGLAARVEDAHAKGAVVTRAPRRVRDRAALPLSPAQDHAWRREQVEPVRPLAAVLRLAGALDVEAMRGSLAELVRRHEALRTDFPLVAGRPTQIVLDDVAVELPVEEVRSTAKGALHERLRECVRAPFDLERTPPLRAVLFRSGAAEHVLLLTLHPVAADAASLAIVLRELRALYAALSRGLPSPLPEPPGQLADFVPSTGASTLPLREKPHVTAVHPFTLSREVAERVRALARRERATPAMVLLAAFQLLLAPDPDLEGRGLAVAAGERWRMGADGVVGPLASLAPLPIELAGDPTFRELLHRVRGASLAAYDHPEGMRAEERFTPSAAFLYDGTGRSAAEVLGERLVRAAWGGGAAEQEMMLRIAVSGDGLACEMEYASDRFDAGTVQKMTGEYQHLLRAALSHPRARISALQRGGAVRGQVG